MSDHGRSANVEDDHQDRCGGGRRTPNLDARHDQGDEKDEHDRRDLVGHAGKAVLACQERGAILVVAVLIVFVHRIRQAQSVKQN